MKETWFVEADCDEVIIQSEMFQTEDEHYDYVTISDQGKRQFYSGKQMVYQNASSSFSIAFHSDDSSDSSRSVRYGFILNWTCIKPKQT